MKPYFSARQILFALISFTIFTAKSLGLLPFRLDRSTHRLTRYRFPLLYPTLFLLCMLSILLYSYRIVIPSTQTQYQSDAIQLILGIRFITYSLTLLLTYVRHYTRLHEMEAIFTECVTIFQTIHLLKIRFREPCWKLLTLFLSNFMVIPTLQFAISFARMFYLDVKASEHYFFIFIISYPNTITSLLPCLFYILLLGVFYALRLLNDEIRKIMKIAGNLETKTQFRIQQGFCELSDSLDIIGQVHLRVSLVAQRITDLVIINLVMWIVFKACALLMTLYTTYTYCVGWAFFVEFGMPIQVLTFGLISLLVTCTELTMFVHMCWTTMKEVI